MAASEACPGPLARPGASGACPGASGGRPGGVPKGTLYPPKEDHALWQQHDLGSSACTLDAAQRKHFEKELIHLFAENAGRLLSWSFSMPLEHSLVQLRRNIEESVRAPSPTLLAATPVHPATR